MTLVVCPNPTIDRVLVVPRFTAGTTMRARLLSQQAGGKGANVVRALRALGGDGLLAGFAAGSGGRLIAETATAEGMTVEFVAIEGDARVSTVVLAEGAAPTRLFEYGPRVGAGEERALLAVARARAAGPGEWAVVNGAAPPGAADGFYGALCAALQAAGFRVLVDATGVQLAAALWRGPELVKVNRREALAALKERPDGEDAADDSDADPLALCERLISAGAHDAVVTVGAAGAAAIVGGRAWRVPAPPVDTVNSTGSGDCFTAALVLGIERGQDVGAALAVAAGAAGANAADPVTGRFDAVHARQLATLAQPVAVGRSRAAAGVTPQER